MKKIFITLAIICLSITLHAQNLGIGTTSPDEKVHVQGSNDQTLKLQSTFGDPGIEFVNGSGAFGSGSRDWKIVNDAEALKFQFQESGGSLTDALRIHSNNNVIVDKSLVVKDHIYGLSSNLYLSGNTPGSGSYDIKIDNSGRVNISDSRSDTRLFVEGEFGDNYWFRVNRADGVGAFWVAPSSVLAAANIHGNFNVSGTLSKGGGSFKIDHPQDPANKYLYHSFVESPDMMNVYNGNITTDAQGMAEITLPEYFETLNRDFRYQLTSMGTFAQTIVKEEVSGNRFTIQTSEPNVKVSWQVTGIRKDPWAEANRIPNAIDKSPEEKGRYLHPELYGQPESKSIFYDLDEKAGTK